MGKNPKANKGPRYSCFLIAPNSIVIRFDDVRAGWKQDVMLSSDRHHDNVRCDQKLEKEHLELLKERDGIMIDGGDLHCAMQGKFDPRSDMSDLRPENKVSNYLGSLTQTAADFYGPYAPWIAVLGRGNHETSTINRHGCDLTSNLVSRLNTDFGGRVVAANYSYWVTFQFVIQKTVRRSLKLKVFHGRGAGNAPVTRGVIDSNRMAVQFPDADFVMSGHTHDQWVVPIKRERIGHEGVVTYDLAWHIKTPTYKDEFSGGSGWAVEKGLNFKPLGCVWLRLYFDTRTSEVMGTPVADVR